MKHKTILIGVDHHPAYLDEVVSSLEEQDLSNKKVMIETPCHPLPLKYYKRNSPYCEFYDSLYQYLHENKACIIHGDSEELIEKAYGKICDNLFYSRAYLLWSDNWWKEYKKIVCEERDPHFYEIYKKHNPKIIIIGSWHTTYLRERINCKYQKIPKEN